MFEFIKKNGKILCACMICFLLLLLFALYWKKNIEWSRDELPAWKKQKVEEVCAKKWDRPNFELSDDMYYGTCHGCVVIFSAGMLQMITEISVAEEVFSYSSVFSIWVCKAGELVELKDAYEKGWITKENVEDIAEYHRQRTGGNIYYDTEEPGTKPTGNPALTAELTPTSVPTVTSTPTVTPAPTATPTQTDLPVASAPQYILNKSQEEFTTEDVEMLRAYISVLEGLLYDEELPEHDVEVEYVYTTYPDLFSICDIDADGKDELYICHIATYNAGMFSVIYEYKDGKLHRELLADTLLRFYDNGVMIQKAMHNHGMAAGEDSDFWPYTLFQHDKETDTYVAVANVEAWDKSYIETDWEGNAFPDEADADGDGRVYYVMPGERYEKNEPIDNEEYQNWLNSYMEGATARYKLPTLDLTKESIEELMQLAVAIPIPTPTATVDAPEPENLLTLLESNYDGEIPSSASSPYVLQANDSNSMIVFGQGATTLIYVTQDGGITWEQAEIPETGKHQHAIVTCATAIGDTTYCIGYRYWGEYDGTDFYLTSDGGKTWTRLVPEVAIPEEITSSMRYAEAVSVSYSEERLRVQVSCKTVSLAPWSIEVLLESTDMGETWSVVEIWERETDGEAVAER